MIRIPGEEEMKLKATNSNHLHSNSNPSWRTSEEIEAQIWITYTMIQIPKFWTHEKQDKTIQIFELRIWITFTNEAKGWKLDRAIQIIKLLIRITPLAQNSNIAKVIWIT